MLKIGSEQHHEEIENQDSEEHVEDGDHQDQKIVKDRKLEDEQRLENRKQVMNSHAPHTRIGCSKKRSTDEKKIAIEFSHVTGWPSG